MQSRCAEAGVGPANDIKATMSAKTIALPICLVWGMRFSVQQWPGIINRAYAKRSDGGHTVGQCRKRTR